MQYISYSREIKFCFYVLFARKVIKSCIYYSICISISTRKWPCFLEFVFLCGSILEQGYIKDLDTSISIFCELFYREMKEEEQDHKENYKNSFFFFRN